MDAMYGSIECDLMTGKVPYLTWSLSSFHGSFLDRHHSALLTGAECCSHAVTHGAFPSHDQTLPAPAQPSLPKPFRCFLSCLVLRPCDVEHCRKSTCSELKERLWYYKVHLLAVIGQAVYAVSLSDTASQLHLPQRRLWLK